MLTAQQKHYLSRFADRVTFDRVERMLYSHDVGALPSMMKPLIGTPVCDAVVQPQSEEEVIDLAQWARRTGVALTPRGKATSGYGGVIPIKKGVVVDFYRMRSVVSLDADQKTVTVQPGITWEQLDRALMKKGLTLRLYPTSYPSSTVGGWLAQGGAGIGSYEYGYFPDNVLAARVVEPDGKVRVVEGADLELIADAEGTTGLITEITVAVKALEDLDILAVSCGNAEGLQGLLSHLVDSDLPIWATLFINPTMARLKNKAPLRMHNGHPAEERVEMPEAYIAILAVRSKDSDTVRGSLTENRDRLGIAFLSDTIARHEWENRFNLMLVKRMGPSLVPAEVIVPVDRLASLMNRVERGISHPVVKEGIVVKKGRNGKAEAVILGFIPADERSFKYNLVFGLSAGILNAAERDGGRAYATGLYFAAKRNQVLGRERLARMRAHKKRIDPTGILNPGKVFKNGLIEPLMGMTGLMDPLIRLSGNLVPSIIGERAEAVGRDGIPADVAWHAYACSQCGFCIDECDQFYGRGWESQSPRGKWYWLRKYLEGKVKWDQKWVDTFIGCTTCELCNNRCSEGLPIEQSWMKLRGKMIQDDKKMTFPPFEMMTAALGAEGNIWAGYRKDRAAWFPQDLLEKHGPGRRADAVYFAGCTASYVETDIGIATARLLDSAGVDYTYLGEKENCCATPMLVAGKWDMFAETMKKNIKAVKETGAETVVCSCPACDMMWRHAYPTWAKKLGIDYDLKVRHYSEVLAEKLADGSFRFPDNGTAPKTKVTWHDSCHLGRVSKIYEPPRELIKAVPGAELVEMDHNREEAHCCGSVLTLIKEPNAAARIGGDRLREAEEAGAEKILAMCPCCQFQLRVSADAVNSPVEVVDLAHFAAEALGCRLPDPHPEVRAQWAVFEAMIELMTPAGFAGIMGTMWPELLNAMPFGMGPMMKAMGKVPGTLEMMKPVFPVLFPVLLPMMMPKVMPTMLERVKAKVPMPDYMAEQMPELMPRVMDALMPHMIGDVVPLVTQPMIDHLRGKSR